MATIRVIVRDALSESPNFHCWLCHNLISVCGNKSWAIWPARVRCGCGEEYRIGKIDGVVYATVIE